MKLTTAKSGDGQVRSGAPEPLHDVLVPSKKVVEALAMQGLACRGLATKVLQPMGNTLVHLVHYHDGQPDIAHGLPRAECGAHEMGWYAAVNIRTLDEAPPLELIGQLENATKVGVTVDGGERGKVLVTLSHIVAAEMCIYTVSLIGTKLPDLRDGMAKVNCVAYDLLVEKEISPRGMELADGINELVQTLTGTP